MKKIILSVALLACSVIGFSGNTLIISSALTFSPSSAIISTSDSVTFQLASVHNVQEVSQATWNANGTTPLSGGFALPYGGGVLTPGQLTPGFHYYVCTVHASMGMKGTLTVSGTNGITQINNPSLSVSLYPLPVSNEAVVSITSQQDLKSSVFVIYDATGREVNRVNVPDGMQFNIHCGQLTNGLYLYQIINNGQSLYSGKFLVAR